MSLNVANLSLALYLNHVQTVQYSERLIHKKNDFRPQDTINEYQNITSHGTRVTYKSCADTSHYQHKCSNQKLNETSYKHKRITYINQIR